MTIYTTIVPIRPDCTEAPAPGGGTSGPVTWGAILDKPSAFTPLAHVHAIGEVTGLQEILDAVGSGGGIVSWGGILDKPAVFAPAAHTHGLADMAGLQAALDAASAPTAWADIPGKPATYPATAHTHAIAQVEGLQGVLDAMSGGGGVVSWDGITDKPATFPPAAHTHTAADVGAAPVTHSHAIAEVSGLQAALDSISGGGGAVSWDAVLDKPATFAPSAHTHAATDVTGLQAAIDAPPTEQDLGNLAGAVTLSADAPYKRRATLTGDTALTLPTPAGAAAPTLRLRLTLAAPATITVTGVRWLGGAAPDFATTAGSDNVIVLDYSAGGWIGDGGAL